MTAISKAIQYGIITDSIFPTPELSLSVSFPKIDCDQLRLPEEARRHSALPISLLLS